MSASPNFERALLLFEQERFAMAEKLLRDLLAQDSTHAQAQALLAFTLVRQQKYDAAEQSAASAIAIAPDLPFAHFARADVLYHRDQLKAAEAAIGEALRLDPANENFYSLKAGILADQSRWQESLIAAEMGLAIAPEHLGCNNLRSLCLKQLNRLEEAALSVEATIHAHPEDAFGHANQGWLWLERNQPKRARDAFQEALRLQPDLDWARRGMIQALKATNPLYGLFLRYALWMSKLSEGKRWLVVIGLIICFRLLRIVANLGTWGMAIAIPLIVLYISFVLFSWVADPLFNLLLRFNPYGRLLLSQNEITASNWIGSLLLIASGLVILALVCQSWPIAIGSGLALGLVIPTAGIFQCETPKPRQIMTLYTLSMAVVGILGWGFVISPLEPVKNLGIVALLLFLLGFTASSFMANILINRTQK
jgi:tetratricopeptide (TPR) repeat protein